MATHSLTLLCCSLLLAVALLLVQATAINVDQLSKRQRETQTQSQSQTVQAKEFGFVKENYVCTQADVTLVKNLKAGCFDVEPLDDSKVCMPSECNQALLLYQKCKAIFTEQDKTALDASVTKVNTFCASVEEAHDGLCGAYLKDEVFEKEDNNKKKIKVVKVHKEDLVKPEYYELSSDEKDNSIKTNIACLFFKMKMHALSTADAPVLKIDSAFRTYGRQEYFYKCYLCGIGKSAAEKLKCCNTGNKAAKPGRSNHGLGLALDLNTNCGKQVKGERPPELCNTSPVYQYLKAHAASKFGFVREEPTEPWHWVYVGAPARNSDFT